MPWALRAAWVAVLVTGGWAIDAAVAGRSDPVTTVARFGAAGLWVVGVAAMAVPAVASLTATRVIVPLAVPAAVATWIGGAGAVDVAAFGVTAAIATVVAFTGELGRAFVQASAYGAEDRYPLRPPAAYAVVAVAVWAVVATGVIAGPLLVASGRWVAGGALTVLAVAGAVWAWSRWHRLSQRWFVIVPIGLVVHDPLVLAETVMLRRQDVRALHLAPAGTDAADLTGPAAGHALEVVTTEAVTVVIGATPDRPRGTVIHMTAGLVAPTRPGRVLIAAAGHDLPVG